MRTLPNIIITGTPGVGKTAHCDILAQNNTFRHLSINQLAKERDCHDGWDETLKTWIVDEDKLLDSIEAELDAGGNLIDWHACDLFPERLIDLVVVLRTNTQDLYDRLTKRGYTGEKLEQNMDSEIMEVLLSEARDSYDEEIVIEMQSNTNEDMEQNVERIERWIAAWKETHKNSSQEK